MSGPGGRVCVCVCVRAVFTVNYFKVIQVIELYCNYKHISIILNIDPSESLDSLQLFSKIY